jgi:hypothetical protein
LAGIFVVLEVWQDARTVFAPYGAMLVQYLAPLLTLHHVTK